MSLNRAQKRNLALLLVGQAKSVIADWQNVSSKRYNEIEDNAFEGVTADDVRDIYHQWLKYLPHDAWNKVAEATPAEDGPETRGDETRDGDGSATTASGQGTTIHEADANAEDPHGTTEPGYAGFSSGEPTHGSVNVPGDYDEKTENDGIAEHENVAISEQTPIMGSNEIVHEDAVLKDQDDDPSGDREVLDQASAGGPQPFQYR